MPLVSAVEVTKSYAGVPVLTGASCALEPGQKVGLVGRNGAGKTTLLRVLAGLEAPDGGEVVLAPGATAGYLPQIPAVEESRTLWEEAASAFAAVRTAEARLRDAEANLALPEVHNDEARLAAALDEYGRLRDQFERGGGFTYEADIRRTLDGLGFTEDQWQRPLSTMSGGQRARAALARLLLTSPDLLLLDEPTNHLDLDALEWLQAFLQGFRGGVLVVSHDRYLLDAVTVRTFDLEAGRLEDYPGAYTAYLAEREARRARRVHSPEPRRPKGEAGQVPGKAPGEARARRSAADRARARVPARRPPAGAAGGRAPPQSRQAVRRDVRAGGRLARGAARREGRRHRAQRRR